MKKIYFLIALASALVCGCAKSESAVPTGSDEIVFSGYSGRAVTKADSGYADFDVTSGYRVSAYLGSNLYFDDTFVNGTAASTGSTSKTYYWPAPIGSSNTMVFYGVAPKDYTISDEKKIVDFENSGVVDLVITKSDEYSAKAASVGLTFKHALAKVASITLAPKEGDGSATEDYTYTVSELKITADTKGTCNISSGSPAWESLSTSGDKSYTCEAFAGNSSKKIESPVLAYIPQPVTLSVTYSISSGGTQVFSATKTGTIALEAGKSYALSATLSNDNDAIVFNASVSSWGDESETVEIKAPATTGTTDGHDWVQLWAGGPKFATTNLGETTATGYTATYAWTESGSATDAAATNWSSNWKVPTKDDLSELHLAASSTGSSNISCTYTQQGSVYGFLFTGTTSGYTDNSIFIPAGSSSSSFM